MHKNRHYSERNICDKNKPNNSSAKKPIINIKETNHILINTINDILHLWLSTLHHFQILLAVTPTINNILHFSK